MGNKYSRKLQRKKKKKGRRNSTISIGTARPGKKRQEFDCGLSHITTALDGKREKRKKGKRGLDLPRGVV